MSHFTFSSGVSPTRLCCIQPRTHTRQNRRLDSITLEIRLGRHLSSDVLHHRRSLSDVYSVDLEERKLVKEELSGGLEGGELRRSLEANLGGGNRQSRSDETSRDKNVAPARTPSRSRPASIVLFQLVHDLESKSALPLFSAG